MFFLRSKAVRTSRPSSKTKVNPKIVLLGWLPRSSKMGLFLNNQYCMINHQFHRLNQQPAMGVQLNTVPFRFRNHRIRLDFWNVTFQNERYQKLAPIYTESIAKLVGVCSLQSLVSVLKMQYWIEKFKEANPPGQKIQILAYDTSKNGKCPQQYTREQMIEYGQKIDAQIHFIRGESVGKDMNKFINVFLKSFVATKPKTTKTITTTTTTTTQVGRTSRWKLALKLIFVKRKR